MPLVVFTCSFLLARTTEASTTTTQKTNTEAPTTTTQALANYWYRQCPSGTGSECNLGSAVGSLVWGECGSEDRCYQSTLSAALSICNKYESCTGITRGNGGYEPRTGSSPYYHFAAHELWFKTATTTTEAPTTTTQAIVATTCATDNCTVLHHSADECSNNPICLVGGCCSYRPGCQSCCSGGYLNHDCCPLGYGNCPMEGTTPPTTTILTTLVSMQNAMQNATTTTTIPAVVIEGSFAIEVDDPERFVADPNVVPVMKSAIAEMVGVNESWITDIRITLLSRRLVAKRRVQDMNIVTQSGVKVEFDITLPPDPTGTAQVTATILLEEFREQSLEEATNVIQSALNSGVLTNGYNVEVSYKIMRVKESATTTIKSVEDDDLQIMITVIVVVASMFVLITLVMSVLILRKKLKNKRFKEDLYMKESLRKNIERSLNLQTVEGFRMEAGPLASANLLEILHPAEPIPEQQRQLLMQLIGAILDSNDAHNAQVLISYALDERPGDAQGCGRGLFYAAAVLKAFHDSGVHGFLTLPCESQSFRGTVVDILRTPGTACKVLAVLETAAFFRSRQCLEEVHLAQLLNIPMVRLRLEEGLPAKNDWTIDGLEAKNVLMISTIEPVLDSLPTVPPRPQTILTEVSALEDLAKNFFVKSLLMQPDKNDSPANRIPNVFGRDTYNVQNEESDTRFGSLTRSDSMRSEPALELGASQSEPAVIEVCHAKSRTRKGPDDGIAGKGPFAQAGTAGISTGGVSSGMLSKCIGDPEDTQSMKRTRSANPRDGKTSKSSQEKPEREACSIIAASDSGGDPTPKKAKEARSLGHKMSSVKSLSPVDSSESTTVMGCTQTMKSSGKYGNPRKAKRKGKSAS